MTDPDSRLTRAEQALRGLSVGDAFGERFFGSHRTTHIWLATRRVGAPPPWRWTDDTAMALALVASLTDHPEFDAGDFATRLAARYRHEPWRGYGAGMHDLLAAIEQGADWRTAAPALFDGSGSYGNGSAMRVAPLGAWFADDLDACADAAARSAAVTHAHPEARAGAIAVAVAAAVAHTTRELSPDEAREVLWRETIARTPRSLVCAGLHKARDLSPDELPRVTTHTLGNGRRISAQDTVPFCVWSAARSLRDYEGALWRTVASFGDVDTTCAIVGGIVALSDPDGIPEQWLRAREPLTGIPLSDEHPRHP